jgi:hypothetical protein
MRYAVEVVSPQGWFHRFLAISGNGPLHMKQAGLATGLFENEQCLNVVRLDS